jgi:hypothetical protein
VNDIGHRSAPHGIELPALPRLKVGTQCGHGAPKGCLQSAESA